MPNKLKNREEFDSCISKIINTRNLIKKARKRQKQRLKQLRKCESFLRGLMRTHLHTPQRDDLRPQFFFEDTNGVCALVQEFMGPNTENLMPEMQRIPLSEAKKMKMKNGKIGFVIFVSPFHDFQVGHTRFVVNFEDMKSEKFKK